MEETTFTKNGLTRVAITPRQAVRLRADGWREEKPVIPAESKQTGIVPDGEGDTSEAEVTEEVASRHGATGDEDPEDGSVDQP